jgi:gliding motility-associated protein GldM
MSAEGSPRQRMIGMMYLVLTALLALNVTKEVLDSFVLINNDLERITTNTAFESQVLYDKFKDAEKNDPKRVKPYREKADQVKSLSEKLLYSIENTKKTLATMVGVDENNAIKSKEDMDKPSELMINNKKGNELKKAIEIYKQQLKKIIAMVDKEAANKINLGLELKDHKEKDGSILSWEHKNFENVPVVAVVAILSSIQTEVKNAETSVAKLLFDRINDKTSVVDAFEAKVISPSSYILAGEKYEANVFLAAYNSTITPQILLNSDTLNDQKINSGSSSISILRGMGKYEISTTKEGLMKWGGKIRMAGPGGKIIEYPFRSEYTVAKPSVTVSPTKMNVFYTYVQNPISISAPGIPAENLLEPEITNGTISGSKGNYFANVTVPGKIAIITVKARIGGAIKVIGTSEFRIRKLQNPVAKIANAIGGVVNINTLAMQWGILVESASPEFKVNYSCISFEPSVSSKGNYTPFPKVMGGQFDQKFKKAIQSLRMGDKVFFENIIGKQENGPAIPLGDITFTLR